MNNDRNKLIVLLVLVGVLVLAGGFLFLRPKGRRQTRRAPGPKPAAAAKDTLPSDAVLADLASWLVENPNADLVARCPDHGVFGLSSVVESKTAVAELPAVPSAVPFAQPPRLEGVILRGGRALALFDGHVYGAGEQVHNTAFEVVEVQRSSVTLRSKDGRELQLSLMQ